MATLTTAIVQNRPSGPERSMTTAATIGPRMAPVPVKKRYTLLTLTALPAGTWSLMWLSAREYIGKISPPMTNTTAKAGRPSGSIPVMSTDAPAASAETARIARRLGIRSETAPIGVWSTTDPTTAVAMKRAIRPTLMPTRAA